MQLLTYSISPSCTHRVRRPLVWRGFRQASCHRGHTFRRRPALACLSPVATARKRLASSAHGDRYVLHAVDFVAHRRGHNAGAHRRFPQRAFLASYAAKRPCAVPWTSLSGILALIAWQITYRAKDEESAMQLEHEEDHCLSSVQGYRWRDLFKYASFARPACRDKRATGPC